MRSVRELLVCACCAALCACASKSTGGTPNSSAAGGAALATSGAAADAVDAGADAGGMPMAYCPPGSINSSTLVSGSSAMGKLFTAKFVQSTPSPPQRYNNNWVFDFVDASGAPVSDLQMTKADTWMPYHGHGWPGSGTAMPQPGRFDVSLNLNMPGYFRIDLNVTSPSQGSDQIQFFYCFQ